MLVAFSRYQAFSPNIKEAPTFAGASYVGSKPFYASVGSVSAPSYSRWSGIRKIKTNELMSSMKG